VKPIRNSAKAIIIQDGRLLAMKGQGCEGTFYLLPGGGQERGETLHEALRRECLEEANAEVVIGELRFIREYIGRNHEFATQDGEVHQVEFIFLCRLVKGCEVRMGSCPDNNQLGAEWLDLEHIERYRLYPCALGPLLRALPSQGVPIYLGDVN